MESAQLNEQKFSKTARRRPGGPHRERQVDAIEADVQPHGFRYHEALLEMIWPKDKIDAASVAPELGGKHRWAYSRAGMGRRPVH